MKIYISFFFGIAWLLTAVINLGLSNHLIASLQFLASLAWFFCFIFEGHIIHHKHEVNKSIKEYNDKYNENMKLIP